MSTARRKNANKKANNRANRRTGTKRPAAAASRPASQARPELAFGCVELPAPVVEDGHSFTPTLLTFVDVSDGRALQGHLCREVTPEAVTRAWTDVLAELSGTGRPPPQRARTASEALATMLRAAAGDSLAVEVAATPELDRFQQAMRTMKRRQLPPSYFHGQSFPSELIRRFFAAASAFRAVEPWMTFNAEEWLDLEIPQLGVAGAAVSIVTDEGCGGLQIFPDHTARDRFMRGDTSVLPGSGVSAVMFYPRRQLPDSLREEVRRLAFAPAIGLIPALVVRDELALVRPLTRRDYLLAIAVLETVSQVVQELDAREGPEAAVTRHTVTVNGEELTVRLRIPLTRTDDEGDGDEDDDDEESPLGPGVVGSGPRPAESSVHVLKVTLRGSRPPIWRRLEVRSTMTLADLHGVLQVAMGWEDEHLHMFNVKGQEIGPIDHDAEFDERATELWAVAPTSRKLLRYTYDFGDDWIHDIEVEKVYAAEQPLAAPRCLDGRRAGPPEDCGGIWGLQDLLAGGSGGGDFEEDDIEDDEVEDPDDDGDYADIEERPRYDPAAFSIDAVNKILARRYLSASAVPGAPSTE